MSRSAIVFVLSMLASGTVAAQLLSLPLGRTQPEAAPVPRVSAPVSELPLPANGPQVAPAAATLPAPRDQLVVVNPAPPGRMFGSQLFGGTFRGTLSHGFNPNYVIALGDRIVVRLWGAFNFEGSLTVDPQGNIFLPNVGPVAVSGVKSGELNSMVEAAVRRAFKSNVYVYAALDASQPVKVYVTGFVRQPGLYGGLASDSPVSFLDKAGGVDPERGSYLDIMVKRGADVRKRVNLYDFLLHGRLDLVQFQDGDVIVVGPRRHTFSVGGEVFNAYDFEFLEPEIGLPQALAMARPRPGATHISIVRRQGSEKRSEYYPLALASSLRLQDGDIVNITVDRYPGTIQVRVEGAHSGEQALVLPYGARLRDVLEQVRPNHMSRLDAIQIYRRSVKARQKEMLEVTLRKLEEAALSARSKTAEEANLRAKEAELILKFVERARQIEPKGQVVVKAQAREETLLEDGDVIVVPERTSLVIVHGEVLFPTAITWRDGLVIEDYLAAAGGYTQGADTSRVVVIAQDGSARVANGDRSFFQPVKQSSAVQPGDEIMVLPKIETKSLEVTRSITQILAQIAITAKVALGL